MLRIACSVRVLLKAIIFLTALQILTLLIFNESEIANFSLPMTSIPLKRKVVFHAKDAQWQPVYDSTNQHFLVYSAFIETRFLDNSSTLVPPTVRIIGVAKMRKRNFSRFNTISNVSAHCQFWYDDDEEIDNFVKATVKPIRENWNMNYSACFILCPVKNSSRMPTGVSVYSDNMIGPFLKSKSFNNLPKAGNRMQIHRIEERKMGSQEIAACVKPLHYNYSKVWELIEWIEMNKLLGIEHFYLYIHDIAPNTSCVLNEYLNQGTATLLDWNNLPLKSQVDIRTENMFAALNDCLYRAMYKHKYLAFFDLDEYLVPKQKENLTGLLSRLEQRVTDSVSFIFRNAFFYLQWPDDGNYHGLDLVTQKKTMRRNHFQERMERSKFICKPELTVEVGNHWLWEMTHKTLKQSFLKTEVALLHHYRKCEAEGDGCVSYKSEVDKYMWLYRDQLEGKMLLAQETIGKKCGLEPIKRIK